MWQSRVEIEHYSVAYFDHIAAVSTVPKISTNVHIYCLVRDVFYVSGSFSDD